MTFLMIEISVMAVAWITCGYIAYRVGVTYYLSEFSSLSFTIPVRGFEYKPARVAQVKRDQFRMSFLGIGALFGVTMALGYRHGWHIPTERQQRQMAELYWRENR